MNNEHTKEIPQFLKPFLWSYDLSRLDMKKHKNIIIKNILDLGTIQATDWMKENYTESDIKEAIKLSIRSDWSKKSINLWSFIYDVQPKDARF
ncbi:hypothetical protein J7J13_02840 [bacterium]|nr:hypothetical protein [bacterium]